MSMLDIRYIAGLFDGEGSIYTRDKRITVSIVNTDMPILRALIKRFGGGLSEFAKKKPHHKRCWIWRINGKVAKDFLKRAEPHLLIKRKRALEALNGSV